MNILNKNPRPLKSSAKYPAFTTLTYRQYDIDYILFPTELHLKNIYYLYSAFSNLTNVVLLIVLSMIIGKGA